MLNLAHIVIVNKEMSILLINFWIEGFPLAATKIRGTFVERTVTEIPTL